MSLLKKTCGLKMSTDINDIPLPPHLGNSVTMAVVQEDTLLPVIHQMIPGCLVLHDHIQKILPPAQTAVSLHPPHRKILWTTICKPQRLRRLLPWPIKPPPWPKWTTGAEATRLIKKAGALFRFQATAGSWRTAATIAARTAAIYSRPANGCQADRASATWDRAARTTTIGTNKSYTAAATTATRATASNRNGSNSVHNHSC